MDKGFEETVQQFHRDLIKEHGMTVQGLAWGNEVSQKSRFEAAVEVCNLTGMSVLDAGCGFADFRPVCLSKGVSSYTGVEFLPEIYEEAINRRDKMDKRDWNWRNVEIKLVLGNILEVEEVFDIVFILGIGYQPNGVSYLYQVVKKFYEQCNNAVVFTVPSEDTLGRKDFIELWTPGSLTAFCGSLAERWVVRHDYYGTEMMAYLYRQPFKRW